MGDSYINLRCLVPQYSLILRATLRRKVQMVRSTEAFESTSNANQAGTSDPLINI